MKLSASGSTIAIAAMALAASPSLGHPTGPAEASDSVNDSPRPELEISSPSLHPSNLSGLSPALRAGSGQRRPSARVRQSSSQGFGSMNSGVSLESVVNEAAAIGLGIAELAKNVSKVDDAKDHRSTVTSATKILPLRSNTEELTLHSAGKATASDSLAPSENQISSVLPSIPFSVVPSFPANNTSPLNPALPAGITNPFSQPLSQIPGSIPNLPFSLPNPPFSLPNPASVLPSAVPNFPASLPNPFSTNPGSLPSVPNVSLPNPINAVPGLPVQLPNPGGVIPNSVNALPGPVANGIPLNSLPQSAGVNPFGAANPLANAGQNGFPGSVPGLIAAQAIAPSPASKHRSQSVNLTSGVNNSSLPAGVIAPTAPEVGDVPPLLFGTQPPNVQIQPVSSSAEHSRITSGAHRDAISITVRPLDRASAIAVKADVSSASDSFAADTGDRSTVSSAESHSSHNHSLQTQAATASTMGATQTISGAAMSTSGNNDDLSIRSFSFTAINTAPSSTNTLGLRMTGN